MDTKVISVRVSQDFFEKVGEVADRLYPKSYAGQPNRTQLVMDALKLFCDLGEAGSLDGINLSQIDTEHLVYSVNNSREDILKTIQEAILRIENKLDSDFVNSVNKESEIEVIHPPKKSKNDIATHPINEKLEGCTDSEAVNSVNKTVNSVNEENKIDIFSLQDAWEIAKSKGFESNKESFRKRFGRRSDNPDFILMGFKRIKDSNGRNYVYQLVEEQD